MYLFFKYVYILGIFLMYDKDFYIYFLFGERQKEYKRERERKSVIEENERKKKREIYF